MENREELEQLQAEIRSLAEQTQNEFGTLHADQLNWKPAPGSWSVAQCFDHLITSNKGYFPIVESVVGGQKKTRFLERVPILPTIWSNMKAPAAFQPSSSDLPDSIIQDFVSNQGRVVDAIASVKNLNIDQIVITSPAAAFVTYSLLDAFRIIVVHEQRHFQQAMRVKTNANFPN
jgi:hypothetical protein